MVKCPGSPSRSDVDRIKDPLLRNKYEMFLTENDNYRNQLGMKELYSDIFNESQWFANAYFRRAGEQDMIEIIEVTIPKGELRVEVKKYLTIAAEAADNHYEKFSFSKVETSDKK